MTRALCGLRPTGRLHLGHYFSVIEPGQRGVEVLIANYHAPEESNAESILDTLHRFGVEHVTLQRDVFNPELYFRLLVIAPTGELERMTQYKSAEQPTAQLLTYPVLMAHDVAGFDEVLVGDDQRQHLEYAARLLRRYNRQYKAVTVPTARIIGGRVRDLRHPESKMSKSSPAGCLFLDDDADTIRQKIRRATMTPEGRANLVELHHRFVATAAPDSNETLKTQLADALIELLAKSVSA